MRTWRTSRSSASGSFRTHQRATRNRDRHRTLASFRVTGLRKRLDRSPLPEGQRRGDEVEVSELSRRSPMRFPGSDGWPHDLDSGNIRHQQSEQTPPECWTIEEPGRKLRRLGGVSMRSDRALARWREAEAVRMRMEGLSYHEIAKALGYRTRSAAWKATNRALERNIADNVNAFRFRSLVDLDILQDAAWKAACEGDPGHLPVLPGDRPAGASAGAVQEGRHARGGAGGTGRGAASAGQVDVAGAGGPSRARRARGWAGCGRC